MDKYDLVLDIAEHPEKYSPQELERLLADPEVKELYGILAETASALNAQDADLHPVDIDKEWKKVERRLDSRPTVLRWFGSRAAAISGIAVSSLVAVAIGIGIGHYGLSADDDDAVAQSPVNIEAGDEISVITHDNMLVRHDSVSSVKEVVVFEDETLETILTHIAAAKDLRVRFANPSARTLRLYFKWNTAQSPQETVDQLNNFEQIKISLKGKTITVD